MKEYYFETKVSYLSGFYVEAEDEKTAREKLDEGMSNGTHCWILNRFDWEIEEINLVKEVEPKKMYLHLLDEFVVKVRSPEDGTVKEVRVRPEDLDTYEMGRDDIPSIYTPFESGVVGNLLVRKVLRDVGIENIFYEWFQQPIHRDGPDFIFSYLEKYGFRIDDKDMSETEFFNALGVSFEDLEIETWEIANGKPVKNLSSWAKDHLRRHQSEIKDYLDQHADEDQRIGTLFDHLHVGNCI